MSTAYQTIRIETLVALALSRRWPRRDEGAVSGETVESRSDENDSTVVLNGLSAPDRESAEAVLHYFAALSVDDQGRWLASRLDRIRAGLNETGQHIDEEIHSSQIVDALRREPRCIQSLLVSLLPASQKDSVAEGLGLSRGEIDSQILIDLPESSRFGEVVRRAFFAQFVFTNQLLKPAPLDLLSRIELARLIRLLGVRETAIACRGIAAVETVTAFLKRFSAEDAHAIVFHLRSLSPVEPERMVFAETIARKAINEESSGASTLLDRAGLALLAIALGAGGPLRRRHTAQKLPLAAARELNELIKDGRTYCDRKMASRIAAETQSLADILHRSPVDGPGALAA